MKYDTIVVGSGFGGAVVASRLAEAGRSVCLLEKGRRWETGEFPRTFGQAARGVWDQEANYGFLDYRVFSRMDVIQGVGVGGGSLVYFNAQLRAPDTIFQRPEWPGVMTRSLLDRYYERVEAVTTPAPFAPPAGAAMPAKTGVFLEAARRAGYSPDLVPVAVHTGPTRDHPMSGLTQHPCTYTADCMLGCRARAKNSLDVTYVPVGERAGLEVRPLHLAERIEPVGEGYAVAGRSLDPVSPGSSERFRVEGRTLVLSAGTVGTNELLLRARDRDRTLPRLPASVGMRFSGNGDMLFAATAGIDAVVDPSQGPSITAGAFVQRAGSRHIITVQDLGYPPALTSLFDGTIPVRSRMRSLGQAARGYVSAARRGASFPARALFEGSFVPHLLPYLGIGTDAADGRFSLDGEGRLRLAWDPRGSAEMFAEMEEAMTRIGAAAGGHFVRSLPWRWPARRLLTAHPLGGCGMSDSAATGVVNDRGEVWGHPGLFVADGSVIPGPLAVNPSLTIAAVAERIAQWMVQGREA